MEGKSLISIIVPVYNAVDSLERCVNSILAQTYSLFELILVDDGSSDGSSSVCDSYVLSDQRIKVIHQENQGVSAARNAALKIATGVFLACVDSDDYVEPKYIEDLVTYMKPEIGATMSYGYKHCLHETVKEQYPSLVAKDNDFDELFQKSDLHWHTAPWGKLFRMDVIKKNAISFPVGINLGEDACFLYSYLLHVDSFVTISANNYHYIECQSGSLTKKVFSFESERRTMKLIHSYVDKLIYEKKIRSEAAVDNLGWAKMEYQRRTLNAAYSDDELTGYDRLAFLKSCSWNGCRKYFYNDNLFETMKGLLLELRLFKLYDYFRKH